MYYNDDNPIREIVSKYRKTVTIKVINNDNDKPIRISRICKYRDDGDKQTSITEEIRKYFEDNDIIYAISIHDDWLDKSKPDYEESKPDCKTVFISWFYHGDIKQYSVSVYEEFAGEDG